MIQFETLQQDFPILKTTHNGKQLVYLDSTATSLKPKYVLEKLNEYYQKYSANVFRGIYSISEEATSAYEGAREKVASFIHAASASEVIFTRNTSESINLVAYAWGKTHLKSGDSVCSTIMEHHSNFVPWQRITAEMGGEFKLWKSDESGLLNVNELSRLITRKTKLFTFTALSNVLGTINPVKDIVKKVKELNPSCIVLVDAAQWIPHRETNVQDWDADFVAFSGHKMLGPTGIGVLWGKLQHLESMPPFLYGGEMIREVHEKTTVYKEPPHKFEAGTPHIAGAIGLGAACDYLKKIGMDTIQKHEEMLTKYALSRLSEIDGLQFFGPNDSQLRGGVIAFTMKHAHAHDISQILAEENICIRAGNHCAMPLHESYGIAATARASFYIYTHKKDIDTFISGLLKVNEVFS